MEGLQTDDVCTVVHIYDAGKAYEVEFMTLTGQSVAVMTVLHRQLRSVQHSDISHVRQLTGA